MIVVRKAESADHAAIAAFDEWQSATPDRLAAGQCFVAIVGGVVHGLGIFDRSFFRRPFVAIIFVHSDHRREGVGTALLEHFESMTDGETLWISTNIENRSMQRLLQSRGYRAQGLIHDLGPVPEVMYNRPS